MQRIGLILAGVVVAICTPWMLVKLDLNSRIHLLPGGWNVMLVHSNVLFHSPRNHPYYFSLKNVFVTTAFLVLAGLIVAAAALQSRSAARGFEVQKPTPPAQVV